MLEKLYFFLEIKIGWPLKVDFMKYESDAKKILAEFSEKLEEMPKASEVFYNTKEINAFRPDCEPIDKKLYDKIMQITPNKDKKGFINVERTKLWLEKKFTN